MGAAHRAEQEAETSRARGNSAAGFGGGRGEVRVRVRRSRLSREGAGAAREVHQWRASHRIRAILVRGGARGTLLVQFVGICVLLAALRRFSK